MEDRTVIVVQQHAPFAHYARLLGLCVEEVGEGVRGTTSVEQCEALYWELSSIRSLVHLNIIKGLLLKVPHDCMRILNFNLKDVCPADVETLREPLAACDMLKLENRELQAVCELLGMRSQSVFDNGFGLMSAFGIKTLILCHDGSGCHVFHDNAVSEKWGYLTFGEKTAEEVEGAFMAAFYVALRGHKRLFTECHRMALDYAVNVCTSR